MKFFRFLIAIVSAALLCSACTFLDQHGFSEPQPTYEYTEVYRRLSEPYGGSFAYAGNMLQVTVEDYTYEFDGTIAEEECSAFVTTQEKLCDLLEGQGISTAGLTFYILRDYPNRTDSDNQTAYFGLECTKSWEQVFTTIQVCLGDYTNYGYLYALSNRIASDLRWICDDVPVANEQVLAADPSLLNLVYPCFSTKYSDTESIVACKSLSIELLATTEDIWSETEFLKARESYGLNKSIDFEPTYVTFAYNGESCPLKLCCQYLEVFWDSTFVADTYAAGYIPTDYTEGVSGLIHTFEWLDEQLTALCQQLGVAPDEKVLAQMTERLPRGYTSQYHETGGLYYNENGEGHICVTTVTVLSHEYVHHIYWLLCGAEDPDYEQWYNEVVAYYYSVGQPFEYRINIINNVDPSYRETLEAYIGEAYDEPSDFIKFLRIGWRESTLEYVPYLKRNYDLACTFGEFFVRTYGEEIFLNSMMYPSRVEEFTGSSMDEIIDEWIADMRNPEND